MVWIPFQYRQRKLDRLPYWLVGLYNYTMLEITPLQPHEVSEARRVIYITAHHIFDSHRPLEETIQYYQTHWPLRDMEDYQQAYNENGGVFLVLRDGGRIVGTGALRRLEERVGEIKRLRLLTDYQGKGYGYQMMMRLLAVAREKGYTRVRLETNPDSQANAIAFYKRLGFYEIPNYGDDPDDIGMELFLDSSGL